LTVDTNIDSTTGDYIAADLSGNGNYGDYISISPGQLTAGPSAYIPYGATFDGSSAYVDLSVGSNTARLNFGGRITMEAWVQTTFDTLYNLSYIQQSVIAKGEDFSQGTNCTEMGGNYWGNYDGGSYSPSTGIQGQMDDAQFGGNDDGGGDRKPRRQAARVASPRRQASDKRPGFRLSRRLGLGDRVDPGDGVVLVTGAAIGPGQGGKDPGVVMGAAIGLGPPVGLGGGHRGDCPVFEVGGRLDVRGEVLDDLADVAVLSDNLLAVTAAVEMTVEPDGFGRAQGAEDEVEGVGVGKLDVPVRKHRRCLAGRPARLATCLLPWPSGI